MDKKQRQCFTFWTRFGLTNEDYQLTSSTLQSTLEPRLADFTPTTSPFTSLAVGGKDLAMFVQNFIRQNKTSNSQVAHLGNHTDDEASRTLMADDMDSQRSSCMECHSVLHEKKTFPGQPTGLLQVFDAFEGPVKKVVSSPTFGEFVTIDEAGSVYLLRAVSGSN
jgi:hypothetical protein